MENAYNSMVNDIYARSCQAVGKSNSSNYEKPVLRKYDKYIREANKIDFSELEELVKEFQ